MKQLKDVIHNYLPYGVMFKGKRKGWVLFDDEPMILCPMDLHDKFEEIQLIVRPPSNLTIEIYHNGEKFTPITKLIELSVGCSRFQIEHVIWALQGEYPSFDNIPYWIQKKLLAWHFDLFSLIESNQAIKK